LESASIALNTVSDEDPPSNNGNPAYEQIAVWMRDCPKTIIRRTRNLNWL
jgi:hypothetical protein